MFILHNGNKIEELAKRLLEVMGTYEAPPLAPRIVVVNNPGMANWLSFQMAASESICANVHFPMPATFIGQLMEGLLPEKELMPSFNREQLAWVLIRTIPQWVASASMALPGHLKKLNSTRGLERDRNLYYLAHSLAELFERYLTYRPEMILAWEKEGALNPGTSKQAEELWQSSLWRFTNSMFKGGHRASLFMKLKKRLKEPLPKGLLPSSISIFGISHLPPAYLELFFLLARHLDIHLFYLNPCKEFWEDAKDPKRKKRIEIRQGTHSMTNFHPLLESLGRVGRDFLHIIFENLFEPDTESVEIDHFIAPGEHDLLSWLQGGILKGQWDNPKPYEIDSSDISLQIHSCHSPLREIEVLHDQLLDLFSCVPGLKPHEVMVMAPDIQRYAPFIQAVFGSIPTGSERYIPWSLADLSPGSSNPILQVFLKLLDLSVVPPTAPLLMDILEFGAISRRFGIDEEQRELVRGLVAASGIRRGLGFEQDRQNTWRFGMDRLFGSYSFAGGGFLNDSVLPFELPLEGENARAIGSLSLFVTRVHRFLKALNVERSPSGWQEFVNKLIHDFFSPIEPHELEGIAAIRDAASKLRELGEIASIDTLNWGIVREFFKHCLSFPVSSRRFITGKVVFSSLMPMRAIPARVICLLGMNDTDFPRRRPAMNFDLMAKEPRAGDKSQRDEDRYLFLETLLSARDCLYISYVGRDLKDNMPKMPSGIVSELLDFLEQNTKSKAHDTALKHIITEHPLMPFSAAYSRHEHPRLFTYAAEWCKEEGQGKFKAKEANRPFFITPVNNADSEKEYIDLSTLLFFFTNPARFFLSRVLDLDLYVRDAVLQGDEPFFLGSLDHYLYVQDIVKISLEKGEEQLAHEFLKLKGQGLLPFSPFDQTSFLRLKRAVFEILPLLKEAGVTTRSIEIKMDAGKKTITGQILTSELHGAVSFRPAKITARDKLSLWINHLVAALALEGKAAQSVHIGAQGKSLAISPIKIDEARAHLSGLVETYLLGATKPLPLLPEPSLEFAKTYLDLQAQTTKDEALSQALRRAEKSLYNYWPGLSKQARDRWIELAFRGSPLFGEDFIDLSLKVFSPLLKAIKEKGK